MKKLITLILVACVTLTLVSCGAASKKEDSKFLGTWTCTEMVVEEVSFPAENLFESAPVLELLRKGEATFAIGDYKETGTWEETQDGAQFVFEEPETVLLLSMDQETLVMLYPIEDQQVALNFVKG